MTSLEVGSAEWLAAEFIQARLVDSESIGQALQILRDEEPFADALGLANQAIKMRLITGFQAEKALAGEAKRLSMGPYVLRDIIGSGSFGPVYEALGKSDQKRYAMKVLPARSQWKMKSARQLADRLQITPPLTGLPPLIDLGTAFDQHYLVWPFVEGRTLASWVQESGPLPSEQIAIIALHVIEVLNACQQLKLWHGYLTPNNISIGYDGKVRLLDLGIAMILADNLNKFDSMIDTCSLSRSSTRLVECASPETVLDPRKLSQASDLYSFGCSMYYAATGTYPFLGETLAEKVYAIQKLTPTPPRELNPQISLSLQQIILRLMARYPTDRYRHLADLKRDLDPLATQSVVTQPEVVSIPVNVGTPIPGPMPSLVDTAMPGETPKKAKTWFGFWSKGS